MTLQLQAIPRRASGWFRLGTGSSRPKGSATAFSECDWACHRQKGVARRSQPWATWWCAAQRSCARKGARDIATGDQASPIRRQPDAISKAVGYAQFFSRSYDAVIRVHDAAGNVIETHEHPGEFKEWWVFIPAKSLDILCEPN